MLLSTAKPVVGCLPPASGANGSRPNAPPPTMLRLNSKTSSNVLQETVTSVSRREVMYLAATGIAISLANPANAQEVANSGNPFSQFVESLKESLGLSPKPKTENKTEPPKPDTKSDEKKPPVENKAEPSKPKAEGGEEKPTVNGHANGNESKAKAEHGEVVKK